MSPGLSSGTVVEEYHGEAASRSAWVARPVGHVEHAAPAAAAKVKRGKRGRRGFPATLVYLLSAVGLSLWSLCDRLPVAWASALGAAVFRSVAFLPWVRRPILANIAIAFPRLPAGERGRLVRAIMANAGRTFGEFPHLGALSDPDGPWLTIRGRDHMERSLFGPKPVIFVSGHIGNWEVLGGVPKHLGKRVTFVYTPVPNSALDSRMTRYRLRVHSDLLEKSSAARGLITTLHSGDSIGLVVDQGTGRGVDVPFFGSNAYTWSTPARIALKYGIDIVPVHCRRVKGPRFEITFYPPISPSGQDDERTLTAAITRHFESWIARDPADWLCIRPRWPRKSRRHRGRAHV